MLMDGLYNVETIRKDEEPTKAGTVGYGWVKFGDERLHCRFVDWDETREKVAMIAANKHAGEWDMPKLTDIALELDALNIDLSIAGFKDGEL